MNFLILFFRKLTNSERKGNFNIYSVVFLGAAGQTIKKGLAISHRDPDYLVGQTGAELLLKCSVQHDAEFGPLTFNWTKNGSPVDLNSRRVQLLSNGSLYIRRVRHRPKKDVSDNGRYKCFVKLEKVGQVVARDVRVEIAGLYFYIPSFIRDTNIQNYIYCLCVIVLFIKNHSSTCQ